MYSYNPYYEQFLAHHGVKGMHWGIRRYQPYTHGQKGVFKNLRRDYKSNVKSLKKQQRAYERDGDDLASAGIRKQLKDLKREYKSNKRSITEEFDKENYETYKEKIATSGTEKQVNRMRKELSGDQLRTAIDRISKQKDLKALSLRDVEKEVAQQKAIDKMNTIIKGAQTISTIAGTVRDVSNASASLKNAFGKESNYDKAVKELDLRQRMANIERTQAQTEATRQKNAPKSSQPTIGELMERNRNNNSVNTPTPKVEKGEYKSPITVTETNPYKSSKAPGFEKLSKSAQNGVKAYEKAIASGKSESEAVKSQIKSVIATAPYDPESIRVPVSVARQGNKASYEYVLSNSSKYNTKTVSEAKKYFEDQAKMYTEQGGKVKTKKYTKEDTKWL